MYDQILIPFTVSLAVVTLCAVLYRIRDLIRKRKKKHYIYRCRECGYIYILSKNMPMQNCPRCGHLNEIYRQ